MADCDTNDACLGVIAEVDSSTYVDNCDDSRIFRICLGGIYSSSSARAVYGVYLPFGDCLYEKTEPNGKIITL